MIKICKLGFHDKEKVGDGISCMMYIKVCLDANKPYIEEELMATRDFFIDRDAEDIYAKTYDEKYSKICDNNIVHDYVCVKCGKCYNNVSFEKLTIQSAVKDHLEAVRNKEIRKKMAHDLYKENCEKD